MNQSSNLSRYQETSVNTASGEQLVVMLYEGAIQSLRKAVTALEVKDLDSKHEAVDRALAIVGHLQSTLDMQRGGEIAVDLDRLYTYITSRIIDGSTRLDTAPLQEAMKLLTPLHSAWEQLANKKQESTVATRNAAAGQPVQHSRLQVHG